MSLSFCSIWFWRFEIFSKLNFILDTTSVNPLVVNLFHVFLSIVSYLFSPQHAWPSRSLSSALLEQHHSQSNCRFLFKGNNIRSSRRIHSRAVDYCWGYTQRVMLTCPWVLFSLSTGCSHNLLFPYYTVHKDGISLSLVCIIVTWLHLMPSVWNHSLHCLLPGTLATVLDGLE